jgi:molybdopterin-guanine dinucleotide biosynthesis protein A
MCVAGFVLVGGHSLRMGQNKARLRVDSRFLVELIASRVAEVAESVTLIGNPQAFRDLPFECLADLRPGLGPLAGLETALASSRAEFNFVHSCDMPGIPPGVLERLLAVCRSTPALCAMARDAGGRRHPLCAVYHGDCLPFVRAALDAGRLRLLPLVEELKAVEVPIDSILCNLNTPEEWATWQAAQPA